MRKLTEMSAMTAITELPLPLAQMQAAAREALEPSRLTWIVVGDLDVIERPIRELGFGEVRVLDADGRTVR